MKYIDAEKLLAEIEIIRHSLEHRDVRFDQIKQIQTDTMSEFCKMMKETIDSLQQEQQDAVLIPRWCLENIENTLRIQHNINSDLKDGETCQDRNIKESLNCVRKLLNGEEITGLERLEPLMKQSEVDLDKESLKYFSEIRVKDDETPILCDFKFKVNFATIARHFFELGLNARKED